MTAVVGLLIRNVEIGGRGGRSVWIEGGLIRAVGPDGAVVADAVAAGAPLRRIDGAGGALLVGLHDHHLHMFAAAARLRSVFCGPPQVSCWADLAERLAAAARAEPAEESDGWIRAVGWDDTVAGWPDRDLLDVAVGDRPVRLQHRSGAMWVLNGAALAAVGLDTAGVFPPGVEVDDRGRPTGRLTGLDAWLRERAGGDLPDLGELSAALAARGVTGVTDATAHNGAAELAAFAAARGRGALRQRVTAMTASPRAIAPDGVTLGPVKIVLSEASLPSLGALCAAISAAHAEGRAVAVHAASRVSVVLAAAALGEAGARLGDRIEHASVVPPEMVEPLADLAVTVVTQPHFVAESGDRYLATVEAADLPWLYRCRSLIDSGVPLAAGSDTPVGGWDPWVNAAAATQRRTGRGEVIGPEERLGPEEAIALYCGDSLAPGGPPRSVEQGAVADLCLLDRGWSAARRDLAAVGVAATVVGGDVVHQSEAISSTNPHSSAVAASSGTPDSAR